MIKDDAVSNFCYLSLLIAQQSYHRLGLLGRLIDAAFSPLDTAISSAPPNSAITNSLARKYGPRHFQLLTESLAQDDNTSWSSLYSNPGFESIPTLLGDRDTEIFVVRHPLVGRAGTSKRHLRRLDTFYLDTNSRLSIVHLAEPLSRITSIISGAIKAIRKDKPTIVVELDAIEQATSLAKYLEENDYFLLNSAFQLVSSTAGAYDVPVLDTIFIGLPKSFLAKGGLAATLWPHQERLVSFSDWQQALVCGFVLEAKATGIHFSQAVITSHFQLNDDIRCEGFYPAESHDNHTWRWLGPKPMGKIYLPRPKPGKYEIRIAIIGLADGVDITLMNFFVDGTPVSAQRNHHNRTIVILLHEFYLKDSPPDFDLTITVSETFRPNENDSRRLGACISSIELFSL